MVSPITPAPRMRKCGGDGDGDAIIVSWLVGMVSVRDSCARIGEVRC